MSTCLCVEEIKILECDGNKCIQFINCMGVIDLTDILSDQQKKKWSNLFKQLSEDILK
jgi:hypothetical protein